MEPRSPALKADSLPAEPPKSACHLQCISSCCLGTSGLPTRYPFMPVVCEQSSHYASLPAFAVTLVLLVLPAWWVWSALLLWAFLKKFYLAALGLTCSMWTLSWGMWDLVPWPGIKPGPPALGAPSLSHGTTSEALHCGFNMHFSGHTQGWASRFLFCEEPMCSRAAGVPACSCPSLS